MDPILLQVCGDRAGTEWTYLTDFEFIKAFTCTFANSVGLLVAGTLVYGGIGLFTYVRTGSIIVPFVLLVLVGGAVLSQVAGVFTTAATLLFLLTGAGVITYLYARLSR